MKFFVLLLLLFSVSDSKKAARVKRRKLKKLKLQSFSDAKKEREIFSPPAAGFQKSLKRKGNSLESTEKARMDFFKENPDAPLRDFIEEFNIRGFRNAPPVKLKSPSGHFGPKISAFGSTVFKKRLFDSNFDDSRHVATSSN